MRSVCYEAHAHTHDADFGCRDSAAWCPYCQKVWLQLEEKQIPYVIEKINMRCYGDKPAAYTAKVLQSAASTLQLALQCLMACLVSKLLSGLHTSRTLALFDTRLHCCSSCDTCETCRIRAHTFNNKQSMETLTYAKSGHRSSTPGTQFVLHMQLASLSAS